MFRQWNSRPRGICQNFFQWLLFLVKYFQYRFHNCWGLFFTSIISYFLLDFIFSSFWNTSWNTCLLSCFVVFGCFFKKLLDSDYSHAKICCLNHHFVFTWWLLHRHRQKCFNLWFLPVHLHVLFIAQSLLIFKVSLKHFAHLDTFSAFSLNKTTSSSNQTFFYISLPLLFTFYASLYLPILCYFLFIL